MAVGDPITPIATKDKISNSTSRDLIRMCDDFMYQAWKCQSATIRSVLTEDLKVFDGLYERMRLKFEEITTEENRVKAPEVQRRALNLSPPHDFLTERDNPYMNELIADLIDLRISLTFQQSSEIVWGFADDDEADNIRTQLDGLYRHLEQIEANPSLYAPNIPSGLPETEAGTAAKSGNAGSSTRSRVS